MDNFLVKPELIPLLNGLKPYLGSKGQTLADSIMSVVQLLTSQAGQEAFENVAKMLPSFGIKGVTVPNETNLDQTDNLSVEGMAMQGGGFGAFGGNFAFVLLLVLILLF
ncbi:MAG: hypothetical protein ACYC21_07055 [Eubacteriales bacterium]